ncbi:MAG: choice-of-anchor J domain-containing protein [Candidatus Cloacimonetes bacterium]|nr:choice-of-anchor J domain-containing protein [Candidatus Cloacimonadota bacterium]
MKKILLLTVFLVLLMGMMSSLFAQATVTVGEGTTTNTSTGSPSPYGTYFKNFRQQYLILASELENSGGGAGNISSVAFNVQTPNTCSAMPGFTIRMKQTTQTALTTTFEVGEYSTVFSSPEYLPVTGWNIHSLTTPFNWDGNSNILVDIVTTIIPGTYSQNASVFYTPTTFQSSLRYQSDSTDASTSATGTLSTYRANIRFNMPAFVVTNPPNPAILLYPANGDYVFMPATLSWQNGGGAPASYDVYFGTAANPPFVVNQIDSSYLPTVQPGTTYYWKIVPRNAIGPAVNIPIWSFRTPTPSMITESFEATTFPPPGWANLTGFTRSTSFAFNGTASAYKYSSSTAPAILSTPILNITAGSTIQFYARTSTANDNQRIQVKYSSDRVTWLNLGEPIALASNAPFAAYSVVLTPAVGNRYIGLEVSTIGTAGGVYIDAIFAPDVVPLVPDAVILAVPADAAIGVLELPSLSWTLPSTGGVPTSYKIYMDINPNPVTLYATATASPYACTIPLTYGATYYWKVVASNAAGDAVPSAIRSFTVRDNPVISTFPWNINFGTVTTDPFPPTSWTKHSGVLAEPTVLGNHPTGSWIMDDWRNVVTTPADKAARINIYGTINGWLITPPINLPGVGYQLEFDMALVDYGNSDPAEGTGVDDKFAVLIGDGTSWTPANVMRMWDNEGSAYAYSDISSTGERVILSLGENTGMRYIAFYGISTVSNNDNDFMIDNVTVRQSPTSPIFAINPESWDYGQILLGASAAKQFVVSNNGVGALGVNSVSISGSPYFSLTGVPAMPQNLTFGQNFSFGVNYAPTVAGNHTATITITDNRMTHTVQLNAIGLDATIYTLPYAQAFDEVTVPALPPDWSGIYQSTVTTGYVKTVTTTPQSTPNCVGMANSGDAAATAILIAPPLHSTIATNSARVKFYAKGSTSYSVIVGVMSNPTDPATFVEVQTITLSSAWAQYSVPLTAYVGTGKFVAFKHASTSTYQTIYIDDVDLELIAANDLAAINVVGNTTPSMNNPTVYTVNVFNNGTASQSAYSVKLYNAAGTELATAAGTTVAAGATAGIPLTWTPTAEGPVVIYGKVIFASDVNTTNNQTPNLNVTVMPAGIISVTIGDGSTTARMPIDMYYKNSVYQTIYYPEEIGLIGNILSVSIYNNFVTTTLVDKPTKIWMGMTTQADLSAGWIPSSQMTLVFDGTMTYPSGENTITFPLSTMFPYTGGNLVVMWNRPMDTAYFSSSDYFKCQIVGTNRAREIHNDATVYDPNAMTGGTLTGTFPKTTLIMTPMTGDPVFMVNPATKDFGTVLINTTNNQSFSVVNAGGGSLTINSVTISGSPMFSLQNVPTLPVSLNTGQTMVFTGRYNPTAEGTHAATITITDNLARSYDIRVNPNASRENRDSESRVAHTIALSGNCIDTTINALPYAQNFDAVTVPELPPDWSSIYQSTSTTGYVKTVTTTPQSPLNCVGMANSGDAAATAILIAPPLHSTIATNSARVKFYAKGSTSYSVIVGVMSNPTDAATFTAVQTITLSSAWAEYSVPLTTYTGEGKYVAFKHGSTATYQTFYIDTVNLEVIAANDLAAINVVGNTTPSMNSATVYTVNVFNNGTASQNAYSVKLYNAAGTELATAAGTTVAAGEQLGIPLTWTPTAEGPATIYGKVIFASDVNTTNNQTPNLNITVMPAGILSVTVGEGGINALMPINMYWKSGVYQTLYYPEEIGMIGNILSLSLYNNFVTTTLADKPTKIWMGITTQTDLSAGWIPSSEMTLVFDGTMTYPAGENTITFPLSTMFPYTGGNLVVMWNRPLDTVYFSSSDYFKCQVVGTNRARNITSDSIEYDPNAMTGGTLTGTFPKTTLIMTPMTGDPVFMVNPATKNFGTVILNSTHNQSFSVVNAGGGSLTINSVTISGSPMFSLQNVPTLPVSLNTGQTMVFTGRYSPTAPGTHAATITITDNLARSYEVRVNLNANRESKTSESRVAHTLALSGICIDTNINALPYAQNFDAVTTPALPPDWLKLAVSPALVQTYTTTPHSEPNCAGMTNSTDANATAILIAPPLGSAFATNTTRVKFWARSSSANYILGVGIISDATNAATYTETQSITLTTTMTEYVVTFAGYTGTGKHVAFKHGLGGTYRTLYVDDVMIEVTPTNDLAALSVVGNTTPSVGSPSIYNVNVFNWGTAAQSTYTVKLYNAAGTELATTPGITAGPGATVQVPLTWTPTAEGADAIYAKVILTGDQNPLNDQSNNLTVVVLASGTFAFTVGEGDQTANIPINMFWKSSLYETMYYPSEMGDFMGMIDSIQLYANFTQELLQKPTKVWIGTTTQADLSAGWIPSTDLTLVYDGLMDYPLGENLITIPFNESYLYLNGENLVLMFFRPQEGSYWNSSNVFKCQTDVVNNQRAIKIQSDSEIYDPAAPPIATTSSISGQFPKTTFLGIPGGVGHINGIVLGAGNQPLQDVAVQITNSTYSTITNAAGFYEIRNILPNTYNIGFSKYGYVSQTLPFTLEEDETEVLNLTLAPMATVSLGGTVLASDTAAGLVNVTIQFSGYQNYTATTIANGTFSIPAVYANQSYTYTASCPGYRNASGTVAVATANHVIPAITLNEIAFAPYSVVATQNEAQTAVGLAWQVPNPLAVDVMESFEAATFPPANWTQVINNTEAANENGVFPTWCGFGTKDYYGFPAVPTNGTKQAGIAFSYSPQNEWLITHPFYCPPEAIFTFSTFVFRGSTYNDHYYVKVSTNGGQDWTVLWDATTLMGGYTTAPLVVTLNVAHYAGQQIKLAFQAYGPNANEGIWYDWYIDNIKISNVSTTLSFNPEEMIVKSVSNTRATSSRNNSDAGVERVLKATNSTDSRSLTGYKVWRLRPGQEGNETLWNSITPEVVGTPSYNDTGWNTVGNGTYRWAVKAIYTNGVASIPVFSNTVIRNVASGNIVGVVRKVNNQPLAGATVSAGGNATITNSSGLYSLNVPVGVYSVTCSATGYLDNTANDINVIANQNFTLNFSMVSTANEDEILPVTATALNGNYPNPFNPETSISYAIKDAGNVSLEIYNLKGQRVRSLVRSMQATGNYRIVFDGKDDHGQPLSSGVYLYRLNTGTYTSTRKMMLME